MSQFLSSSTVKISCSILRNSRTVFTNAGPSPLLSIQGTHLLFRHKGFNSFFHFPYKNVENPQKHHSGERKKQFSIWAKRSSSFLSYFFLFSHSSILSLLFRFFLDKHQPFLLSGWDTSFSCTHLQNIALLF